MSKEIWRDRPGPIGSVEEKEWHEQHGLPLPDPVAAIKGILRAVGLNEPVRIVSREYDATGGFKLTDKMVSRLEVVNAVGRLSFPFRQAVEYAYLQDMTRADAARKLGVSQATLGKWLTQAFDALVTIVFDYRP